MTLTTPAADPRTLPPVHVTLPALLSVPPAMCLSPDPLRFSTPLVAMVNTAPEFRVPPVQLNCPLTVSPPLPPKLPLFRLTIPLVLTTLAPFRIKVFPLVASVCHPLAPPNVRLLTVGLASKVTV